MTRTTLTLCDVWYFQPDPTGAGESLGYWATDFNAALWIQVHLPADFTICHPMLDAYEGAAWFRRIVAVPEDWRDKRVVLHFEGVNYHAKIWINGHEVGEHADGFLPFEFEVQDVLNFGGENIITVCADNIRRPGEVPGLQRGWRTFGGILREVSLMAMDPLCIEQVEIRCKMQEAGVVSEELGVRKSGTGCLKATVRVHNGRKEKGMAEVRMQVMDVETVLAEWPARIPLEADATVEVVLEGDVPSVQPWSPESPKRYTVQVTLHDQTDHGLRATDYVTLRTGFRTIEARDGRLWLNGAPLFLTGFNRHEDSPRTNMSPDIALTRRDLEFMKDAGANFVRLCHYPHHPAELDLCDELGLLVMGEIPLYWWDGNTDGERGREGEGVRESRIAEWKLEAAKRQLRAMVARDGHHPSVIFWSVSNETQEERPEVAAGNRELVRLAKSLDSTRLAVHVSDHWQRYPNFDADDVICLNGYPSLFALQKDPRYDLAQSTAFWRAGLAELHAQYPDKPILITEFGATSLHGVHGGVLGEDTHAAILAHEFAGMDAPYVCGATVWCWADHPWPATIFAFCNDMAFSPFGVLNRERKPRAPYWTIRRLFRQKQGVIEPPPASSPQWSEAGYVVYMIRPTLSDIPPIPFPEGFSIRPIRPDEGGLWADIERDAEPYFPISDDLFANQFGYDPQAIPLRCYFVVDERGVAVGTISAWYNQDFIGGVWGQIHWVALRRAYWGKGLAKPMLFHALTQMARWHDRAFLGTQTKRLPAIKLYLDFGFVPDLDEPGAVEAWRTVAKELKHPALTGLGL